MTGGSKKTAGFTKEAQNSKFIRKRDIKQKDSELRKEDNICKKMVTNICTTCREKLQWRFKFDKYKPLTKPGNCQECKLKNITKAYRTYCDSCALKKKVCPGCCKEMCNDIKNDVNNDTNMDVCLADTNSTVFINITKVNTIVTNSNKITDDQQEQFSDEEVEEMEEDKDSFIAENMSNNDISSSINQDENHSINPSLTREINDFELVTSKLSDAISTWDERKYSNMANNKYSKNRIIGKDVEY